jgi:hypothetical protein
MPRTIGWCAVCALLLASSCARSTHTQQTKQLTQRQRDSILATEPLPGAHVVGSALKASDAEAERAAKMDSLP